MTMINWFFNKDNVASKRFENGFMTLSCIRHPNGSHCPNVEGVGEKKKHGESLKYLKIKDSKNLINNAPAHVNLLLFS